MHSTVNKSTYLYSLLFLCFGGLTHCTPIIDVVIPCHEKDTRTLDLAIEGIKKYGKGVRRVITVSAKRLTDQAEWFDEALYPFSKRDLAQAIWRGGKEADKYYKSSTRLGWIYQQFLKLYAPLVIPDIAPNVLILDSDTIFLSETEFIDSEGYALFNVGSEYHEAYFELARRLLPELKKVYPNYSGICHHMLFQRHILEDLFTAIRTAHQQEPWQALCKCIDLRYTEQSCISEYEIYFNFIFFKDYKAKIRRLSWANVPLNSHTLDLHRARKTNYLSCHSYL